MYTLTYVDTIIHTQYIHNSVFGVGLASEHFENNKLNGFLNQL